MATVNLTEQDFAATIEKEGIVFLDFWADWCGPCKAFAPVYEAASEKHADITFGKVNTEEEQALAGAFGITSIPTLMIFRDGIGVFAQPGMLPAAALDELIEKVKELDMDDVRKQVAAHEAEHGKEHDHAHDHG